MYSAYDQGNLPFLIMSSPMSPAWMKKVIWGDCHPPKKKKTVMYCEVVVIFGFCQLVEGQSAINLF